MERLFGARRRSEVEEMAHQHRRSQSDTSFRLDDEVLAFDVSDLDLSTMDLPLDCSDDSSGPGPGPSTHLRSLSVDSDFFDSFMDKKPMGANDLALLDPKRAKRILANRQSAARSKERKIRYTGELERKVQTLQTEATTLSAHLTMLQRDTSGLTTENKELKLRLQALEQQAQLRDALNEALREEVQRLKIATGQIPAVNGSSFNRGVPNYSSQQPAFHQFGNQQQPHYMQQPSGNQTMNMQPRARFSDLNKRV